MEMRKIIYLLSVLFILSACGKTGIFSTNEIKGKFTDYEGKVIYAVYENFESGMITDTILMKKSKFKCNLKLNDNKTPVYLLDEKLNKITNLFIKEGDEITLSGSSKPYEAIIRGDSTNLYLGCFLNENSRLISKYDSLKNIYIDNYKDSLYLDELVKVNDTIVRNATYFVEFNPSSPASTFVLYEYIASPKYKILSKTLSEKLNSSAKTDVISARVEHFAALQKLDKGKVLPYSQLKTVKDSLVYSYTYKNKITILTFWDSSDSLSISKVKEVELFYDTLKQKNKVSIHMVSLDTDKNNWITTVDSLNSSYFQTHLSDGWMNKDISTINLRVVPSVFLLNRNGIIIGRELEFDSLSYLIDKAIINNDSIDNIKKNRNRRSKK